MDKNAQEFYYRPLLYPWAGHNNDSFRLAGGWCAFSQIEVLSRIEAPKIIPAKNAPEDIIKRLTKDRAPLSGVTLSYPRIMGIINITPDSFSDGGDDLAPKDALHSAHMMKKSGADFLDIGGESTRPGADFVPANEEVARILPVISALTKENNTTPISVDTRKANVAAKALDAGAKIVNDVSALTFDKKMAHIVAKNRAPICLMHAQGSPKTMQHNPIYDNVLLNIYDYLENVIKDAQAAGIKRENIIIDPGIGFGKTVEHNCKLIKNIALFHGLGVPILLGGSRKSFIQHISPNLLPKERLAGSLATALYGISQGVHIVRVHDTYETSQALTMWYKINNKTA